MQLTATEATCPLCKHPVNAVGGHSDPTRLCENCRRLVHTIRSTSSASVAVIDTPHGQSMPQPPVAIPVQTEVQITEVVAQGPSSSHQSAIQTCEPDLLGLDSPAILDRDPFDFDELFDDVLFGASLEPPRRSSERSDEDDLQIPPVIAEPMREAAPQQEYAASLPAEIGDGAGSAAADFEATFVSPAELNEEDPVSDSPTSLQTDNPPVQPFLPYEVVTNQFENPLQGKTEDRPLLAPRVWLTTGARLKVTVAATLIICFGIAGYLLMYRPSIQASQTRQATTEQASAAVSGSQQPLPTALASASEAKESPVLQTENESSERRFSLQAAAFPNEGGANQFCERLKRAGVPAYVVSAEIAGRGRWFRVRVGRFETAQDADRFASESRRRARAAGLNLQLIVSSYDKP